MYTLTVDEAAERLGVTTARVYQLIHSGGLEATKIGRFWLVDDRSVEARAEAGSKAGRPRKSDAPNPHIETYTLMNRTHRVLTFTYNPETHEFVSIGDVFDPQRAPLGIFAPRGKRASVKALEHWWSRRTIPLTRPQIREKLDELHLTECSQIPFLSYGLSLADQYWIAPERSALFWGQVNFFHNRIHDAPSGTGWLANVGQLSPDNTTGGSLSKRWVDEGRRRWLYKDGGRTPYQGPYNEAVATALYRRLLAPGEYVPYEVEALGQAAVCRCEAFVDSREEFIPASAVRSLVRKAERQSDYAHYVEAATRLGVPEVETALAKMIVCDYLLANSRRHWDSGAAF